MFDNLKQKVSNTKAGARVNARKAEFRPASKTSAEVLLPRLVLIIATLALVLFGLVMVFSASCVEAINNNDSPFSILLKQGLYSTVGIIIAVLIWRVIPFRIWKSDVVWVVFALLSLTMLLTLVMGTDIYGARRWIYIGSQSIQPSEFAKIVLILLVAKLYTEWQSASISTRRFLVSTILVAGLTLVFIYKAQSDLGTTVICGIGILGVFWLGGAPKSVIAVMLLAAVGVILFGIFSTGYRLQRFEYFLDPYNDGEGGYGKGYQIIRSRYALAEGGIFGVGLGNSYEKFQYLPEAETDFIYAIICEELGMLGGLLVAALFIVFLIAGLYVSKHAGSVFGKTISGAFVVMIVFQAFLNIFCVVGLFPTTGKPLPLISSGGSSMLATLAMVGFVLAASEEAPQPDIYQERRSDFKVMKSSIFGTVFSGGKAKAVQTNSRVETETITRIKSGPNTPNRVRTSPKNGNTKTYKNNNKKENTSSSVRKSYEVNKQNSRRVRVQSKAASSGVSSSASRPSVRTTTSKRNVVSAVNRSGAGFSASRQRQTKKLGQGQFGGKKPTLRTGSNPKIATPKFLTDKERNAKYRSKK